MKRAASQWLLLFAGLYLVCFVMLSLCSSHVICWLSFCPYSGMMCCLFCKWIVQILFVMLLHVMASIRTLWCALRAMFRLIWKREMKSCFWWFLAVWVCEDKLVIWSVDISFCHIFTSVHCTDLQQLCTDQLFCNNNNTRLTALCPSLPWWVGARKAKSVWILLKQETMSGSGIGLETVLHFCTFLIKCHSNLEPDDIVRKPMKHRFQWYIVHTEILSTFHARVEYISGEQYVIPLLEDWTECSQTDTHRHTKVKTVSSSFTPFTWRI